MGDRKYIKIYAIVLLLLGVALFGWYYSSRSAVLSAVCRAGLPNFSRPSLVDKEQLGCTILSERRRFSGVLTTGFEHAGFIELSSDGKPTGLGGWHTCNQVSGCDRRTDAQLDRPIPGTCGGRMAMIVFDGWVTESVGQFGHMGLYPREFFEDKVIAVGAPPEAFVAKQRKFWAKAGKGICDGDMR